MFTVAITHGIMKAMALVSGLELFGIYSWMSTLASWLRLDWWIMFTSPTISKNFVHFPGGNFPDEKASIRYGSHNPQDCDNSNNS